MNILPFFDQLTWKPDRLIFKDLVFRLEHARSANWDLGNECFRFFKTKELIDQYRSFFGQYQELRPKNLFEIGTYDGGSTVFWNELLQPIKHVSIDITEGSVSQYFHRYVNSHGLNDRIAIYWQMDQADKQKLHEIVSKDFVGAIDMVIDDASHMYQPTLSSFEALFPLLNTGGFYIIEDWAWGHWPEFYSINHPWKDEVPLTHLITQLIEAAATSTALIAKVVIYYGFVVIERGPLQIQYPNEFTLENHIARHPLLKK